MAPFAGYVPTVFTPALMYQALRTEKWAQILESGIIDRAVFESLVGGRLLGDIFEVPRKIRPQEFSDLDVQDMSIVDTPTRVNTGLQKYPVYHASSSMEFGESDLYRTGEEFERSIVGGFVDRTAQKLLGISTLVMNAALDGISTHNLELGASMLTVNAIQQAQGKLGDRWHKLRTMIAHPNCLIDLRKELRLDYVENAITGTKYLGSPELRLLGIDRIIESEDIWKDVTSQRAAWVGGTTYATGDFVRPTTKNGYEYEATTGGAAAASPEPTWPTTIGATVVDNAVTWTCRAVPIQYGAFVLGQGALAMRYQKESRIWTRIQPEKVNAPIWSTAYLDIAFGLLGTTWNGAALPTAAALGTAASWASSFDDYRDLMAMRIQCQAKGASSDWLTASP